MAMDGYVLCETSTTGSAYWTTAKYALTEESRTTVQVLLTSNIQQRLNQR